MGRSRKDPHSPHGEKFLPSGGGGEKKLFLIIVNVLGHSKGVGGLTSNFLRGGGGGSLAVPRKVVSNWMGVF
jgi:hypothetical protein